MKKYLFTLLALSFSLSTLFAQKYGETPEDSVKCVQSLSLYREFYKQKSYEDAYKHWNWAFLNCPKSSKKMYVDGLKMIKGKIKNLDDKEKEGKYIDTILMIYDQRIEHFGQEGYVLGRKGLDMLKYRSSELAEAYKTLDKSIQLRGVKSEAGALAGYFTALVYLEKKGEKTEADVVKGFNLTMDIIGNHIDNPKTGKYYKHASKSIQKLAGPYLDCEILLPLAKENYEKNKDNEDWLLRMAGILNDKECTDDEIYAKIAEDAFTLNPTADAAGNMGKVYLIKKDYDKAIEFYDKALELSEKESDEFNFLLGLVQAKMGKGQFSSARSTAYKAAKVRPESGLPYILIGDMYVSSASSCGGGEEFKKKTVYWAAVDMYQKAKSIDASVAGQANKKIGTYSKFFPEKKDVFFHGLEPGGSYNIECWISAKTTVRTSD